ncbi:hypothetical protein ABUE31_14290 [Mesorhizobium sp. ZMM04-5]|uniref:Anti-sigma factor n=1 Tax=Mesorhizobium marinum TaxID=3228790 RepID=A0ABV3R1T2_9HYPH
MEGDGDRMERAQRYVLGLMDDEERERAERDLETDHALREAMVEMAGRMRVFERRPAAEAAVDGVHPDDWRLLKERLEAMPQMRPAAAPGPVQPAEEKDQQVAEKPVTFGRRRSDRMPPPPPPAAAAGTHGTGLHSVPGRRALLLALCLIAAFVLGFIAGRL